MMDAFGWQKFTQQINESRIDEFGGNRSRVRNKDDEFRHNSVMDAFGR